MEGKAKSRMLTGSVPLEDEFKGIGALRSVLSRLLHAAARYLPMYPQWRVRIHRWRGVKIGKGVFIGSDVFLDNTYPDSIVIEDYVAVTSGVFIVGHFIMPLHFRGVLGKDRPTKQGVVLKKGCYIGPKCIITDGITVGQCAVVGAGSVVTKDIPGFSIAVGNPAKVARQYDKNEIPDDYAQLREDEGGQ
jgi:acetyltransferase-like isoleucine patch superfamily enzyme